MYNYRATVERIVDGDTVMLAIDCGFRLTFRERMRVAHVNALELTEEGGATCKAALAKIIPPGTVIDIVTNKPDKWGRWLFDAKLGKGKTLSTALLQYPGFSAYEGEAR